VLWSTQLVSFGLGWVPLAAPAAAASGGAAWAAAWAAGVDAFAPLPPAASGPALLRALSRLPWPSLRALSLQLHDRGVGAGQLPPRCLAPLQRWLGGEGAPQLQSLRVRLEARHSETRAVLTTTLLGALAQSGTITELDVTGFKMGGEGDAQAAGGGGSTAMGSLQLHPMPMLRVLRCDIDDAAPFSSSIAESIALAPNLEVLQLYSTRAAELVCRALRFRCNDPSRSPVPLRELHTPMDEPQPLSDDALEVLALLPRLESLSLVVARNVLYGGHLELPDQLRSLTIQTRWGLHGMSHLAHLNLPQLRTLVIRDSAAPADRVSRPFSGMPLEAVLQRLLHRSSMPSLTRLHLPYVADEAWAMRRFFRRSGLEISREPAAAAGRLDFDEWRCPCTCATSTAI